MSNSKQSGFTLAELLVALAILGVLSAIAIPNYSSYTTTSQFSDGKEDVYRVMAQQERYFMNNMKYTTNLGGGGIGYTVNNDGELTSPEGHFLVTADVCIIDAAAEPDVSRCVRVTAEGLNKQAGIIIWLQSDGDKSTNME